MPELVTLHWFAVPPYSLALGRDGAWHVIEQPPTAGVFVVAQPTHAEALANLFTAFPETEVIT